MYIATVVFCISVAISFALYFVFSKQKSQPETLEENGFSVCEYYDRIEKEQLKMLEEYKPVDQTIILWWGFDGLRLNEDGSIEWISRRKPEPVSPGVFYQPINHPIDYSMFQNAQATREQIFALKMQSEMMNFNIALQNQMQGFNAALQSYVIQTPAYPAYPSYLSAGSVQMQPQLIDCCCNYLRQI